MRNDLSAAVMAAWATRELPGRLDVVETAKLLGFAEHDVQILMAVGKLMPLGDPAPNAPKWFASIEIIKLSTDQVWLHKATKELSKYWRNKRGRRQTPVPSPRSSEGRSIRIQAEKVSPNSSPKVTPEGQWRGNNGAMRSDERATKKAA